MTRFFLLLVAMLGSMPALAELRPIELHQVIAVSALSNDKVAALTLDACGGKFDVDLVDYLIAHRIPATIFATKKWLDRNPAAVSLLKAHADLFEMEDHGANHVPSVVGPGRRVYGILGNLDAAHLEREVLGGASAVRAATGELPHWYRGATAEYDPAAINVIEGMGYQIAGFSINADSGATLRRSAIIARLRGVKSGDIIIAHVNKPASDTAAGLSVGLDRLVARGFRFVKLDQVQVRSVR
jgi:peptidoglycan/xylan/chitin deacetylase (PgdA/CDA1 family)